MIWYLDGEGVGVALDSRAQSSSGSAPYDRYAVGLHHAAFEACLELEVVFVP